MIEKKYIIWTVSILVIFLIICLEVTSCLNRKSMREAEIAYANAHQSDKNVAQALADSVPEKNCWDYDSIVDEMSDKTIYFANLISDNIAYFDFPYEGGTNAKLTVRKHPKYGTDVMFMISQGQLLCNDYDGTNYVTVRFDNAPAERYYTNEPSDMSSEMLFLRNSKRFIAKAKNAKKIRIQAPVYNNGNVVFIFTTDSALKWNH